MNDVIDILDMGGTGGPSSSDVRRVGRKKGVVRPKENPPKRPDGMHRELYALLCADGGKNFQELAPILPTDAPGGYKKKIKLGARKVREWRFEAFAHPGRKDDPFLRHWRRLGDETKEYPFAKFNAESSVPQYTETEYTSNLEQDGWTKGETDHLFDLCKRFDMRFLLVKDRWDRSLRQKSVEEIKERYYNVCNALNKLRLEAGTAEPIKVVHYDADHETRRKEQLRKLWSKTSEQVEEEEFLRSELKKIEARKKEREKKTQDLQKLITAADAGSGQGGESSIPGGGGASTPIIGTNLGKKLTSDQKKIALLTAKKKSGKTPMASRAREGSLSLNAPDVFLGIKWPDFKSAGAFVRSQKLKLPSSVGQKKAKAIEQILQLLGLSVIFTPTEEITTQFNELRSDIVLLYELKSALTSCEMEIHSLAHQSEAANGIKLEIPAIFLNDSTSHIVRALEAPTKSQAQAAMASIPSTPTHGSPTAPLSISGSLGVNDLDVVVPHRKRKAALDQANILRKLKSKTST